MYIIVCGDILYNLYLNFVFLSIFNILTLFSGHLEIVKALSQNKYEVNLKDNDYFSFAPKEKLFFYHHFYS